MCEIEKQAAVHSVWLQLTCSFSDDREKLDTLRISAFLHEARLAFQFLAVWGEIRDINRNICSWVTVCLLHHVEKEEDLSFRSLKVSISAIYKERDTQLNKTQCRTQTVKYI